jgi:hypothetical protein
MLAKFDLGHDIVLTRLGQDTTKDNKPIDSTRLTDKYLDKLKKAGLDDL